LSVHGIARGAFGRYGAERFNACTDALFDQAERLARNAIRAMPDGSYAFEDWIDDDGIDPGPIPIRVTITVAGDRLLADFRERVVPHCSLVLLSTGSSVCFHHHPCARDFSVQSVAAADAVTR
jgi:hypothetical protein